MSGRPSSDDRAQLALLDAMVFFAISVVICSVMVSYAVPGASVDDGSMGSAGADNLLAVFLGASLGDGVAIGVPGFELTGSERFGEVLFLLSALALDGVPLEGFEPLLSHCSSVLSALSEPWSPFLRVVSDDGEGDVTLISIGYEPGNGRDSEAASQNLGEHGGSSLTATLVLSPALLVQSGAV